MIAEFTGIAATFPPPFRLLIRETAGSTNDELRMLAQADAPDGLVLLALQQISGRGRRGASWLSRPADSLTFSILVRPAETKALWPRLALAAGLAVAEACDACGVIAGIKWPNDVWIEQRKVAGILVEAGTDFAVVGIGLNVNGHTLPKEIAELATSLQIATTHQQARHTVLGAIIARFAHRRAQIGTGFAELLDAVRQRCVLTGQQVSLTTAAGVRQGLIEGLGPGGELLLRTTTGLECLIQADEVRILPPPNQSVVSLADRRTKLAP